MKNDKDSSINHRIESAFTDDYIGTTPNENRLFIVGTTIPPMLGLTGGVMSLYIWTFPDDRSDIAMIPGFAIAVLFGWFVQISMRRAYQMKDRDRRIVLVEKLRIIPPISIGVAFAGLVISLAVWFFPPPHAFEVFHVLAGFALLSSVVGALLTPFALAARRIGWLIKPR